MTKIYNRLVINIETGCVLESDWFEGDGPGEWAKQTGAQKASDVTNVAKGQAGLAEGTAMAGTANASGATLLPAYQSILKDPGYSAADKSAITLNTVGGIGAEAGAGRDAG